MLGFSPVTPGVFQSFWALGEIWGTFYQDEMHAVITLLHGSFTLKELRLDRHFDPAVLPVELHEGDVLQIPFPTER